MCINISVKTELPITSVKEVAIGHMCVIDESTLTIVHLTGLKFR